MRYFYLIFLFFVISCSSKREVTKEVPYEFIFGHSITTVDTFLCDDMTLGFFKPEIVAELIVNHGFDECPVSEHIASIPKGSDIKLTRIIKHTGYGLFVVKRWFVIGEYSNGNITHDFVFQLPWIQDSEGNFMRLEKKTVPWQNGV